MINAVHSFTKIRGDRILSFALTLALPRKSEDPKISICPAPTGINGPVSLNKQVRYKILSVDLSLLLSHSRCSVKRRLNPSGFRNLTEQVNQSCL